MNKKLKRLALWLIPPILFFAFFSLNFIFTAKYALYPDFSSDISVVLQSGALTSIVYLLALVLYSKFIKKSAKIVVVIVTAVVLVFIICFGSFMLLGYTSKTTDINNYLAIDEGSPLHNNNFDELLPSDVPENSVNHVYDYCYRNDLISGSYLYAEWTLPKNEYIAEKQRIADSAEKNELKCYKYEKQDVFSHGVSSRYVAQFSFSDADCRISYYISNGVIIDPVWEKPILK